MREAISHRVLPGLIGALKGSRNLGISGGTIAKQGFIALLPAMTLVLFLGFTWHLATKPMVKAETAGLMEMGGGIAEEPAEGAAGGLEEPKEEGLAEPKEEGGDLKEPPADGVKEPPGAQPSAGAGSARGKGGSGSRQARKGDHGRQRRPQGIPPPAPSEE
jgi:hypothetical protein